MIYLRIVALIYILIAFRSGDAFGDEFFRKGSYELREGNCKHLSMRNVIFQDRIAEGMIPFIVKTATSNYRGHRKIACILALSKKDITEGSTVYVKKGGVGKTYVVLEMESARGHGFDYSISVYSRGGPNVKIPKGFASTLLIATYFLLFLYNYKYITL